MSDLSSDTLDHREPVAAFDRPLGQQVPDGRDRPGTSVRTNLFVICISAIAIAIVLGLLVTTDYSPRTLGPEISIVFAFGLISALVPLQFAYKQEMTFDPLVIVLAALVLPTEYAALVCAAAQVIGYAIRYRFQFEADCPFNASLQVYIQTVTSVAFWVFGWSRPVLDLPVYQVVAAGAISGLVSIVVIRFFVALIINVESRQPFRQVLRDSTLGMQSAEQAMLGAMIALGIMGALIARLSPWALLLLIIPAFALWLALRQNVETRHRIEASLATAQRVAGIGSLDWDLHTGDIRWSEILFQILGYSSGEVQPTEIAYLDRVDPDDQDRVRAAFSTAATGQHVEIDHRVRLPTGEQRSFNLKFNGVANRSGRIRRTVGTIHDVTERKLLEDRLQFQAYHDSLTLLPNRAFFMRKLESSFARYSRSGSIALLFLDLDRFKVINDTLGHDAGDHLLQIVARRLESCIRPNDVVARLGGDEFIILVDSVESDNDIIAVAQRIVAEITKPVDLPGQKAVTVSTSIGIVRPTSSHSTGDDLLRDADTALYRAKEDGRNRFAFFDAAMGAASVERLGLEADLAGAIDRGELSLVYQPRLNLTNGRVQMIEALARWTHPVRGEISPALFIPIAEEAGLIDSIGQWIVRTAISEAKSWFAVLNPSPTVSLNITRRQMLDDDFPSKIALLIQEAGLRNAQFRVEIPEGALAADDEASLESVSRLCAAGFGISIDDFGTGHSSLASLRRFPIDMLQLDRQFVVELGSNRDATTVTQAVIGLAHGLELAVLAEGIERPEQVDLLVDLGCELGQGTYFCPPLPAAEMLAWLVRNQQAAARSTAAGEPINLRRLHR